MLYALITGASKGIGKAIAHQLAARKKNLLLVARNAAELETVCAELSRQYGIEARYLALDLSEKDAARRLKSWIEERGFAIDVLVNNAGYGLSGPFENYSLEEHQRMMQVNMNTLVELTYLLLPFLKKQSRGYVLNIASTAAYQAVPRLTLYAASKSFVLQFSRGLHHELSGSGVTVTCISPGSTDTNFANRANVGEKGQKMAQKVNMTPDAVAKIAVDSMYAGKAEVITGMLNKVGAALAWLLPKGFIEKTSGKIYE